MGSWRLSIVLLEAVYIDAVCPDCCEERQVGGVDLIKCQAVDRGAVWLGRPQTRHQARSPVVRVVRVCRERKRTNS